MIKKLQVWSNGGGTQSACIAALIVQGKLPKPDFAVIADTGREMPTTWAYLDSVIRPALKDAGVEMHRIHKDDWAASWGRDVFATSGDLLVPAYSNLHGDASKLTAFCSKAWKAEVVDRWLSQANGITRSKYVKWIGFSFDETERILRMQRGEDYRKGLIRFPLVNDHIVRRHEAIQVVKKMGWPKPPRSRCWMCPNQSDMEWAEVKNDYPKLFQDAIDLDEHIRTRDKHAFLHSTIAPLKDADLSAEDDLFSAGCHSGECFL